MRSGARAAGRTGGRAKTVRSSTAALSSKTVKLGPLPRLVGFMLRRAQLAVFHEIFRTFSEVDIRPAQFSVLTVIDHNPGLTQSQVSAALGIKRTNLVALLDSLEQRGLAERRPALADRRSHALHLTRDGKAVMRRLKQLVDTLERRLVARIGEDGRDQLLVLLHRLAEPEEPRVERRGPARPNGALSPGRTA